MCFSATASFSASLALIICGIASLAYAKQKRLRMIALIPFIFGLQQFAEGMVWTSFLNTDLASIRMIASYIFLACAGIVWPIWIPLAVVQFEGTHARKLFMPSLMAGIIVALGFIAFVLFYPLTVKATCNVVYYFEFSQTSLAEWSNVINATGSALYILATIVPFFITRNKTLWFLGSLVAISYIASYIFYTEAFTSVWCFFAALISIFVYGLVRNESKK